MSTMHRINTIEVSHCFFLTWLLGKNSWFKVFKNGPSKSSGRQPLKKLKLVCLSRPYQAHYIISNFLKAVFHKFYLVHSWIPWPSYIQENLHINVFETLDTFSTKAYLMIRKFVSSVTIHHWNRCTTKGFFFVSLMKLNTS